MARSARGPAAGAAWIGAGAGAVVGFLTGWGIYTLAVPVLESSQGWLRETQGLVWNVVYVLAVAGAVLGFWLVRRRSTATPV